MTVKELIEELRKLDPHLEVHVEDAGGFTEITEVVIKKWERQKIVVVG